MVSNFRDSHLFNIVPSVNYELIDRFLPTNTLLQCKRIVCTHPTRQQWNSWFLRANTNLPSVNGSETYQLMKARAEGSCLQFDARCTVSPALTGERASLCDAERKNMKLIRRKWNLGNRRDILNLPSGLGAEKKPYMSKGSYKLW